MYKFLRRILLHSFLPSAAIIFAKVVGIIIANNLLNLSWQIDTTGGNMAMSKIYYSNQGDVYLVTTLSNLAILVAMTLGTLIAIFKERYLNADNQSPKVVVKVTTLNLTEWLAQYDQVYPLLIAWIIFDWIAAAIILKDVLLGNCNLYVGATMIFLAAFFSTYAIRTLEKQIDLSVKTDDHRQYNL